MLERNAVPLIPKGTTPSSIRWWRASYKDMRYEKITRRARQGRRVNLNTYCIAGMPKIICHRYSITLPL